MKIAGVGVNPESLPTREQLITAALISDEHNYKPKSDALKDINKQIDQSGLFKKLSTKVTNANGQNIGAHK